MYDYKKWFTVQGMSSVVEDAFEKEIVGKQSFKNSIFDLVLKMERPKLTSKTVRGWMFNKFETVKKMIERCRTAIGRNIYNTPASKQAWCQNNYM